MPIRFPARRAHVAPMDGGERLNTILPEVQAGPQSLKREHPLCYFRVGILHSSFCKSFALMIKHHAPWMTCAQRKLYLSCKSFSTVGSLAVAQIPFQLLCSEWSQIQAGWPLKQVERRTKHESRPKQSYFFNSNFLPSKRVQLAVAPN